MGRYKAIVARDRRLPPAMIDKLSVLMAIEHIELMHIRLKEFPPHLNNLDSLRLLDLSHNRIRKVPKELVKVQEQGVSVSALTHLKIPENRVCLIDVGLFQNGSLGKLRNLDLRDNVLESLPHDFGEGCKELIFIDLSRNKLQVLPATLLQCTGLQFLNVSHNRIAKLPDNIQALSRLRKLFVSFNELQEFPQNIGMCREMEKIRAGHNHLRELPDSFVNLWSQRGGCLEELVLEQNPLVHPSVTAVELSGFNEALRQFAAWVEEKKKMSLQPLKDIIPMDEAFEPPAPSHSRSASFRRMLSEEPNPSVAGDSRKDFPLSAEIQEYVEQAVPAAQHYYFPQGMNPQKTQEIQSLESSLLLVKKILYVAELQEIERKRNPTFQGKKAVPQYDADTFPHRVKVSLVDIHFCYAVFNTKPMRPTCRQLFRAYATAVDDHFLMTKADWSHMWLMMPVTLPTDIIEKMWTLLVGVSVEKTHITEDIFIAGWHIHDLDEKDPWISRVADVLRMNYFSMDMDSVQARLSAMAAKNDSPTLEFDDPGSSDDELIDLLARKPTVLPAIEGERTVYNNRAKVQHQTAKPKFQVSRKNNFDLPADNSSESLSSFDEAELSEENSSSAASFSYKDYTYGVTDLEENSTVGTSKASEYLAEIRSDKDIEKLMQYVPPDEDDIQSSMQASGPGALAKQMRLTQRKGSPSKKAPKKRAKKRVKNLQTVRDPRYKTDVVTVRQALREASRNMPHDDFNSMVNFCLRGLRLMQAPYGAGDVTYWHVDSPAFWHAFGVNNVYSTQLLTEMGLICLDNRHWVWPSQHLNFTDEERVWGSKVVPSNSIGRNVHRLEDLCALLKKYQIKLAGARKQERSGQNRA